MNPPAVFVEKGDKKAPDTEKNGMYGDKGIEGEKSDHRMKWIPFILTSTYISTIKKYKLNIIRSQSEGV
jgi:hypothetical protein